MSHITIHRYLHVFSSRHMYSVYSTLVTAVLVHVQGSTFTMYIHIESSAARRGSMSYVHTNAMYIQMLCTYLYDQFGVSLDFRTDTLFSNANLLLQTAPSLGSC